MRSVRSAFALTLLACLLAADLSAQERARITSTLGYAAQSRSVTVAAGQQATLDFTVVRDALALQEIVRIPDVMLNGALVYERSGANLWLNWNRLGSRFADDANDFELPAFDIFSTKLGYALPVGDDRSVRADVSVYNLLDSAGLTEGDPRLAADVDPTELPYLNARPSTSSTRRRP